MCVSIAPASTTASVPATRDNRHVGTAIVYVAIDDTDVPDSRGTGYLARGLAATLVEDGASEALGITRHQLLVDARIPYTSHNSSACIALRTARAPEALAVVAGTALATRSAPGSDPGLCVLAAERVTPDIVAFGERAKREIVTADEAHGLAQASGARLSSHGGTGLGIIGALAAVGLRAGGNDGRFLELHGIRALDGLPTVAELRSSGVEAFALDGRSVHPGDEERIDVGDWCRPVLLGGLATLLIEEVAGDGATRWRARPREHIRSH